MDCSLPGTSVHEDFPGKNTGVGYHALLQGIFPTQGSNAGLLHCRQILYRLSHQGSPLSTPYAMLSHFSHVRLCETPETAAHQAAPSLGFSRQEHWSGLPFPSPMHESEKWKWSRSVMSDSSRPRGLQPTRLLHPWDFPGKSTGVGCHCLLCYSILGLLISPSSVWKIFISASNIGEKAVINTSVFLKWWLNGKLFHPWCFKISL